MEKGRLPTARAADNRGHPALREGRREVVEHGPGAVALTDVAQLRGGLTRSVARRGPRDPRAVAGWAGEQLGSLRRRHRARLRRSTWQPDPAARDDERPVASGSCFLDDPTVADPHLAIGYQSCSG